MAVSQPARSTPSVVGRRLCDHPGFKKESNVKNSTIVATVLMMVTLSTCVNGQEQSATPTAPIVSATSGSGTGLSVVSSARSEKLEQGAYGSAYADKDMSFLIVTVKGLSDADVSKLSSELSRDKNRIYLKAGESSFQVLQLEVSGNQDGRKLTFRVPRTVTKFVLHIGEMVPLSFSEVRD